MSKLDPLQEQMMKSLPDWRLELANCKVKQTQELGLGVVAQLLEQKIIEHHSFPNEAIIAKISRTMLIFDWRGQEIALDFEDHKVLFDMIHSFIIEPIEIEYASNKSNKTGFHAAFVLLWEPANEALGSGELKKQRWTLQMSTHRGWMTLDREPMGKLYNLLRPIHMDHNKIMGIK